MGIEQDIQQQKKFHSATSKAAINVIYTASWLVGLTNSALKPYKISMQQFNLMRILNGQHPKAASVKLLTERMLDKMSNASRLVDKLVEKGLVERRECPLDRRRVEVNLTEKGLTTLASATILVENDMKKSIKNLDERDAVLLSNLLDRMRHIEPSKGIKN